MTAAGPKALRATVRGPAGAVEAGDPGAVAGPLAGSLHYMGSLASAGLEVVLMTAAEERGAPMAGSGRAGVRALDQVPGVGRVAGGVRVVQVISTGAGGEVSRIAAVGHVDGRCKLS